MNSPLRHKGGELKAKAHAGVPAPAVEAITIGLNAAVVAVRADEPVVAVVAASAGEALPGGLFSAREHSSLDSGLRQWVYRQTKLELGFTQQLCTFEDRAAAANGDEPCACPLLLSVCYLALVGPSQSYLGDRVSWRSWYAFFPWEDWRRGKPACLGDTIEPRLRAWAALPSTSSCSRMHLDRHERLRLCFGFDGTAWDEEKVPERYQLLQEAGMLERQAGLAHAPLMAELSRLQHPLLGDQGRVLACAIGELRRTIKCRPAVFELLPDLFTLFELQKTVEALLGPHLHKQNFRRLVESGGLVEPTGQFKQRTGGRPAQLYRFRRDVLLERLAPGVRVKAGRG
jgi:hypothetical protein